MNLESNIHRIFIKKLIYRGYELAARPQEYIDLQIVTKLDLNDVINLVNLLDNVNN